MAHAKWLPKGLTTIKEEVLPSPVFESMDIYTDGACIDPEDLALTPEPPRIVDEIDPFYDFEECPPSPGDFIRDEDDSDDDFIVELVDEDEREAD